MNQKLRILFFIETGGPGGAEQVVLQLLQGMKDQGHDVFLTTLRTGWLSEKAVEGGFSYHQILSETRLDLLLPWKLAKLMNSLKIDVLHTHLLDSNFYGSLAVKSVGLTGKKIAHVGTEHGDVHHIDPKKHLGFKLKVATLGNSRLTSVSRYSAEKLIELGVNSSKVQVVPNPLRKKQEFNTLRETNNWLWLHVGNLRPVKDQATLIRGFAHSRTLSQRTQSLTILGDGQERESLQRLVKELGVGDNVYFLGHSDAVERHLSTGDGFVMTSLSESLPMALLEAISYGLYPICTRVGGIPEILGEDQLFAVGDWKKLGELMAAVLNDETAARVKAQSLTRELESTHSLTSVCNQYLELYLKNNTA